MLPCFLEWDKDFHQNSMACATSSAHRLVMALYRSNCLLGPQDASSKLLRWNFSMVSALSSVYVVAWLAVMGLFDHMCHLSVAQVHNNLEGINRATNRSAIIIVGVIRIACNGLCTSHRFHADDDYVMRRLGCPGSYDDIRHDDCPYLFQ